MDRVLTRTFKITNDFAVDNLYYVRAVKLQKYKLVAYTSFLLCTYFFTF